MNFGELNLLPGATLNIEFQQSNPEVMHALLLVGYLDRQCIIVAEPHQAEGKKPPIDGELVEVTLFSERLNSSFMFSVKVLTILEKPWGHYYLSYPAFVAKDETRKAKRVATSLIATVRSSVSETNLAAKIIDISVGGCRLTSPNSLGEIGSEINIATKVEAGVQTSDSIINLAGEIKGILRAPTAEGEFFEYGVSFHEVNMATKGLLKSYIEAADAAHS